ncbi:QRFP-like peptide receptor [Exaiptasia diaphana]|uniref:G-protein coupled receptors family 1 profile domain-containing protein n=1 Tax=Exaiptasia diaphana TaxID=2652724 RepID=A0A913Y327_EXADI|nr:QRFP-like peptide receptor [Exaiptasia diaphana]
MAVSDIIAALFLFPFLIIKNLIFDDQWLIGGGIGNALCKLTLFTIEMSFAVSVYSCVAIAIERYFAVAHPFKKPFKGKMKHAIVAIWIVAAVICSPYLFFSTTIQYGNSLYCGVSHKTWPSYMTYHYILGGLDSVLPVLFITITYIFTIYKLYHHKVTGLATSERRRREQQNNKVLKHAVTIVVLLYLCRGLRLTVFILDLERKLRHLSFSSFLNLQYSSLLINCLSLVYNLFIYLIFNDIYRENVKALLPKCCCRSNDNRRQQIPDEGRREFIEMQPLN